MPNKKNIQQVTELTEKLEKAKSIYFTDYIGLNVSDITKLRSEFFENSIQLSDDLKKRIEANDFEALHAVVGIDSRDTSDIPSKMNLPCLVYACEASPLYPNIKKCVKLSITIHSILTGIFIY